MVSHIYSKLNILCKLYRLRTLIENVPEPVNYFSIPIMIHIEGEGLNFTVYIILLGSVYSISK